MRTVQERRWPRGLPARPCRTRPPLPCCIACSNTAAPPVLKNRPPQRLQASGARARWASRSPAALPVPAWPRLDAGNSRKPVPGGPAKNARISPPAAAAAAAAASAACAAWRSAATCELPACSAPSCCEEAGTRKGGSALLGSGPLLLPSRGCTSRRPRPPRRLAMAAPQPQAAAAPRIRFALECKERWCDMLLSGECRRPTVACLAIQRFERKAAQLEPP